jgi:hypothetical protein
MFAPVDAGVQGVHNNKAIKITNVNVRFFARDVFIYFFAM